MFFQKQVFGGKTPSPSPFFQRVLPRILSRASFVTRFLSTVEWCKTRMEKKKRLVVLDAAKWKSMCLRLKTFLLTLLLFWHAHPPPLPWLMKIIERTNKKKTSVSILLLALTSRGPLLYRDDPSDPTCHRHFWLCCFIVLLFVRSLCISRVSGISILSGILRSTCFSFRTRVVQRMLTNTKNVNPGSRSFQGLGSEAGAGNILRNAFQRRL